MKLIYEKLSSVALGAFMGMSVLSSAAIAQGGSPGQRAGTFEFILPVTYSPSETVDGKDGSRAKLDSAGGLGLGFGYNFTNQIQMSGLITFGSRNYDATLVQSDGKTVTTSGNLDSSTVSVNGTYYFMPSDITPFITGGIGSNFVDSNIKDGRSQTVCWWDPWWGYVCGDATPTKTQTSFTYMAGIGMRWDINRSFSMQGSYNRQWVEMDNATPDLAGWKVDFIFRM